MRAASTSEAAAAGSKGISARHGRCGIIGSTNFVACCWVWVSGGSNKQHAAPVGGGWRRRRMWCMHGGACGTHRYVMPRLLRSRTFSLFLNAAGCPAAATTEPLPLVEGPSSSAGAVGCCFRCCFGFCCLLPPSSAAGAAALRFAMLPPLLLRWVHRWCAWA